MASPITAANAYAKLARLADPGGNPLREGPSDSAGPSFGAAVEEGIGAGGGGEGRGAGGAGGPPGDGAGGAPGGGEQPTSGVFAPAGGDPGAHRPRRLA